MEIQTNIPLKDYTTIALGGPAKFMAVATTPEILAELVKRAQKEGLAIFVMGGGSNIGVGDKGFPGLVILNKIMGFEVTAETASETSINIGAGEIWDDVVARTVKLNLTGIEALSAIPGTAGATPVQNVGAYGQEIADTLVELEAYDTKTNTFVTIKNEDCGFTYRNSIFKDPLKRHHIITRITLSLKKANPGAPFYESLQSYLEKNNITFFRHFSYSGLEHPLRYPIRRHFLNITNEKALR